MDKVYLKRMLRGAIVLCALLGITNVAQAIALATSPSNPIPCTSNNNEHITSDSAFAAHSNDINVDLSKHDHIGWVRFGENDHITLYEPLEEDHASKGVVGYVNPVDVLLSFHSENVGEQVEQKDSPVGFKIVGVDVYKKNEDGDLPGSVTCNNSLCVVQQGNGWHLKG